MDENRLSRILFHFHGYNNFPNCYVSVNALGMYMYMCCWHVHACGMGLNCAHYICTFTHSHTYTHIHTYIHICTRVHTYIHTHMYTHMYAFSGVYAGHFTTAESAKQQRQPGLGKVQGTHIKILMPFVLTH